MPVLPPMSLRAGGAEPGPARSDAASPHRKASSSEGGRRNPFVRLVGSPRGRSFRLDAECNLVILDETVAVL